MSLTCPACAKGKLFRRYFLREEGCTHCKREFEREQGYWVGGAEVHMFLSYGLSVLICIPILILYGNSPGMQAALIAGHVALSLSLFRYARALFLAVDYRLDPSGPPADPDGDGDSGAPVRPRTPPRLARHRVKRRGRASTRARTVRQRR